MIATATAMVAPTQRYTVEVTTLAADGQCCWICGYCGEIGDVFDTRTAANDDGEDHLFGEHSDPCTASAATGRVGDAPCPACHGFAVVWRERGLQSATCQ